MKSRTAIIQLIAAGSVALALLAAVACEDGSGDAADSRHVNGDTVSEPSPSPTPHIVSCVNENTFVLLTFVIDEDGDGRYIGLDDIWKSDDSKDRFGRFTDEVEVYLVQTLNPDDSVVGSYQVPVTSYVIVDFSEDEGVYEYPTRFADMSFAAQGSSIRILEPSERGEIVHKGKTYESMRIYGDIETNNKDEIINRGRFLGEKIELEEALCADEPL